MRIFLLGEDPNDTKSIEALLRKYESKTKIQFKIPLQQMTGSKLDSMKYKKRVLVEANSWKPDLLIYIRDLDGLASEKSKKTKLEARYKELINFTNMSDKGIFLLNIFELEALILADIESLNKLYKTKIQFNSNPQFQKDPKEFLINKTDEKYKVSDTVRVFENLNPRTIEKNCSYFREFIEKFKSRTESKIAN